MNGPLVLKNHLKEIRKEKDPVGEYEAELHAAVHLREKAAEYTAGVVVDFRHLVRFHRQQRLS